jgi:hypothetical protein
MWTQCLSPKRQYTLDSCGFRVVYSSFTLVKFVSETVNDSNMQLSSKSHVTVTTVLALATLGSATTNRDGPISVALPKVAKASTSVSLSHVIVASIITLTVLFY